MKPLPQRSGWIAGILSFIFCGLGQVYAGRWRRALAFYLIDFPVTYGCMLAAMHVWVDGINLWAAFGAYFVYRAWVIVDAVRVARRAPGFRSRWIVRWPAYVALFACAWLVVNREIAKLARDHVAEQFRVPTGAMERTILAGDSILVDKLFHTEPARHDVVVHSHLDQEDREVATIKRIIGMPGERIEIRKNTVFVDGRELPEPYMFLEGSSWQEDFAAITVPAGAYFVLGDRRNSSRDSRMPGFGFVPRDRIVGRAMIVTFSWSRREDDVRWNRVGKIIR